jgi:hypothetical protein
VIRAYLHTTSWAGDFAYPVELLSRGPKRCRVRLLCAVAIGKRWYDSGTVKHPPTSAIALEAREGASVQKGRKR